ncbi:MAG: methylmalonyl-CoA epimerase [Gemmatimonadetes bacterium]|uniref:Methylmalonyl-CoA epimerase n=1 Tax=Candidatus Kutchimonas denitrificans TaxID=3056748 RepID=A0AAE4ZCR8_9BACT|nr:methylmalonyl-CoA epimerase [Gemmatimonadota bacterium]NIR76181.1 methylmalonyl-CoA epimerase [Candidatus Kutchimonas denitrificans]NIS00621.1 methylmalonyl-CoA epimerase [Gemmatimonadota bacterium]NIT66766.1 methylmalonyl-CoA epimerase [Gemmatimonadota bacterium]NIV23365.1 methylmalonyl-CoA epimerase [Gemmatimonadota bacterium]
MDSQARLEHVAIAVPDLEAAVQVYSTILGRAVAGREHVESEGVRVAFFELDGPRLELLEPTGPDTPIGRFLERRGPGLHHIALEVPDIEGAIERCRAAGLETVGEAPRTGAGRRKVAFLHPGGTGGVLLELSQRADEP